MNNGVVIFAHNSNKLDYALLSVISGGLARKHLTVPVSLITDSSTVNWMKTADYYSEAIRIFDKIIVTDIPVTQNKRILNDGHSSQLIPFINSNRHSVWELTPYDTTLLIDSDYLIFSDNLNNFWNSHHSVLISQGMNDIKGDRIGKLDQQISETGIKMFWATTVMFKKDQYSKSFFQLVDYIKTHYAFYADLFGFNPAQYRNDISFSIAKHIMNGFVEILDDTLPQILTILDKDVLHSVDNSSKITLLLSDRDDFIPATIKDTDVHILNKQSIIKHNKDFLKLI